MNSDFICINAEVRKENDDTRLSWSRPRRRSEQFTWKEADGIKDEDDNDQDDIAEEDEDDNDDDKENIAEEDDNDKDNIEDEDNDDQHDIDGDLASIEEADDVTWTHGFLLRIFDTPSRN